MNLTILTDTPDTYDFNLADEVHTVAVSISVVFGTVYGGHAVDVATGEVLVDTDLYPVPARDTDRQRALWRLAAVVERDVKAALAAKADDGTCEHGLSADLCDGPQHYPFDRDELDAAGF